MATLCDPLSENPAHRTHFMNVKIRPEIGITMCNCAAEKKWKRSVAWFLSYRAKCMADAECNFSRNSSSEHKPPLFSRSPPSAAPHSSLSHSSPTHRLSSCHPLALAHCLFVPLKIFPELPAFSSSAEPSFTREFPTIALESRSSPNLVECIGPLLQVQPWSTLP